MSDGSYQAVVYSYPVHELVDGVWVEIESTNQNARGDVSPSDARSNIIDNFVWEGHGVQNNNAIGLDIGLRSGYRCRAFIRFATMPTIPAGSTITAATMTVNIVSGTSTANLANAYRVTGEWQSGTIQWSNAPTIGPLQADNISHNNKTKFRFSCLEAVRHWYTNSTTGQNQNHGIMIRYTDETINDYNSFYSADYSNANSRPALTISYTVSGNRIEDGIYRIKSSLNGFSIGASGGISANTSVKTMYSATLAPQNMTQLWRITYLGGSLYSIRPVFAPDMALSMTSNGVCIQTIGTTDTLSGVPASARWSISHDDTFYKLYNDGKSANAMMLSSSSTVPGVSVMTGQYSENSILFRWNITAESEPEYGAWLYDTGKSQFLPMPEKCIPYSQSRTLAQLGLIPIFFTDTNVSRDFSWVSSKADVVSVNSETGAIICLDSGYSIITGTATVDSVTYSVDYTVYSTLPLSGYELEYTPSLWDDTVEDNCNCYAYAINNQVVPGTNSLWYKQQPGEYSGFDIYIREYWKNQQVLEDAAMIDFGKYSADYGTSCTFTPIDRYAVCPAGTYKVALVMKDYRASTPDYHWYRQDADGLWSHKPGTTSVLRTDSDGMKIADPYDANRGDYTIFINYYAVTPWSNMHNSVTVDGTASYLSEKQRGENAPIVAVDRIDDIYENMTLEEVVDILGIEGKDIGYGTIIHEYKTETGTVTISYCIDSDGVYRVVEVVNGGKSQ